MKKRAPKNEPQRGCWICDDGGVLSWPVLAVNEMREHAGPTCETHGPMLKIAVECLTAVVEPTAPAREDWRWLALHLEAAAQCSATGRGLSMSWHEAMAPIQKRLAAYARERSSDAIAAEFKEGMWLAK